MLSCEILDEFDDIISIADIQAHELLFLNIEGRKLFTFEDVRGRKCYEVLQGKQAPCEFCTNDKLSRDAFYTWEYTNLKLGRHILVKDKLILWEDRSARLEVAIDITAREREKERI